MKTVTFHVEKTATGYAAYAPDFSILAAGKTIKAIQQNAEDGLSEQCEYLNESRTDYTLKFTYDFPSLVDATRLNVDALSKLVGLNSSLMSQYLNGKKVPGPKQKQRIEAGIHTYAKILSDFRFA